MAVNNQNPFQKQYVDSFQGKNIDGQELQSLDTNSYFDIISQYNIAEDGTLTSKVSSGVYVPNNPAPEDRSLVTQPDPNPITIPASETVNIGREVAAGNITVSGGSSVDPNTGLLRIEAQPRYVDEDRGTSGKGVSPDAPEDNEYDDDFEIESSSYGLTDDDSETGSPIGLNSDPKSKTKIGEAKDATAINKGAFMQDLTKVKIDPRPNELNTFSSVTYNIALYMMNSKSYVDITTQPSNPRVALSPPNAHLLMRSGGVGLDNAETGFFNDFFIDDVEITNIAVGPSKFKQNTNATDIRFTITEPRGVTLLEKLQSLASTVCVTTKERYIHAPYMLEITFKGYDENGQPTPAPSDPKYIPIRITDMTFEVTSSGTQYKVTAMPFAYHAMGSVVSTIPFNVELQATTVGDIFSSGIVIEKTEEYRYVDEDDDEEIIGKRKVKTQAKNLGDILTDYQRKRTEETTKLIDKSGEISEEKVPPAAEKYDSYKFLIAQEIAEAKLNLTELYDALNTPAPTEESKEKNEKSKGDKRQYEAYVKGLTSGITLDKETQTFKINAGTDISKLINLVILHSDYMDRNIVEIAEKGVSDGAPINWFKIRPVIESATGPGKGMDNKEGRYKYNITFAVEKSNIYYNDFPWAKKGKPVGRGYHKVYNYIYSGNNTEVLSFDLKFRTAFLQVMTAGTGSPFANKDDTFSPVVQELPQSLEGNTINSQDNTTRARAKDLFSSVMSDGVDMVELNMSIVGDPAYLPTSDAYWQDKVRGGEQYTTPFMPDGTINYNLTPPFVQVNLKTPVDYDDNSGLSNPSRYGNSSFSGIYRLTQIDSTFSGGLFQQRIYGLRTPLQPTATGLARTAKDQAGVERDEVKKDEEKANSLTPNNPDNEFDGVTTNGVNSQQATVTDDSGDFETGGFSGGFDDDDGPYTSPTVNNARTAEIARGPDQTIPTIPDVNADLSSSWNPPTSFLKSEPPTFTPTPPPVRVITPEALEDQTVDVTG